MTYVANENGSMIEAKNMVYRDTPFVFEDLTLAEQARIELNRLAVDGQYYRIKR
jgi:hypothetical protein